MPGRNRLAAAVAALVLLHLLVVLAPAEPRLLGTPFGLALEVAVVGLSTISLWLAVRTLLPPAKGGGDGSSSGAAQMSDSDSG